jgi:hypothetical protein
MCKLFRQVGTLVVCAFFVFACDKKQDAEAGADQKGEKKTAETDKGKKTASTKETEKARPRASAETRKDANAHTQKTASLTAALSGTLGTGKGGVPTGKIKGAFSLTGVNVPLPRVGQTPPGGPTPPPTAPAARKPRAGRPTAPASKSTAGAVATYTSPDGKTKFRYPAGWHVQMKDNLIDLKKNPSNSAEGQIQVVVQKMAKAVAVQTLHSAIMQKVKQSYPDLKILKQAQLPNKKNMIFFAGTYTEGGVKRGAMGVTAVVGQVGVFAYYAAGQKYFNRKFGMQALQLVLSSL